MFVALLITFCFSQVWAQDAETKTQPMLEENANSSLGVATALHDGSPSISAATRGNPSSVLSSIIDVLTGGSTSQNSRAPQGGFRYERVAYLITPTEMSTAGFPNGADINLIGFNYSVGQDIPTTGNFKVYLQNTSDVTYGKGTTWATIISTMTLAHNDPITIPNSVGVFDIPFVGGSSFIYTGGGLYVAWEYGNASDPISSYNTAYCNTSLTSGLRGSQSATGFIDPLDMTSNFRPYTRLGTSLDDVLQVPVVYALGKIPIPYGVPQIISAPVKNVSASSVTFNLTLTVKDVTSGTVRFTDTQTVTALAAGATQVVPFASWSPTITENDSIIVTTSAIPGETVLGNNTASMVQIVNTSRFAYSQGTASSGGVGFTGATGDFVAKFSSGTSAVIDSIQVNFSSGGNPYQLGIWDATGAGNTPGTNLFTSPAYTSAAGIVTIPVTPPVVVNGYFYLGVKQTGTTNIGFSFQNENPIRPYHFYYTSPTGGTSWTDFAATSSSFRFMIEANIAPGFPMAYGSSTTVQNTMPVLQNSTNQQIIGIQVVTTGNLLPISATQFSLSTNGTTSTSDISNAKLFYTGTSSVFSTATPFGSTVAAPNGAFLITGSQTLQPGTNYFWLTYDISAVATLGNVVDAECNSVTVAGNPQTPTVQAPTGNRKIKAMLSGIKTVGTAGDFSNMTEAFIDVNALALSGNLTLNIISDLSDTAVVLNQWAESGAGGYTLTIQPSGAPRTITGNSTTAVLKLNGADRVAIDGRIGGTGRNLTFLNTNTGGSGGVIWISSPSASDSATNNTIRNCVITGSSNTGTLIGVSVSGALGGVAPSAAINTVIRENVISKAVYGIYVVGVDSNRMGTGNQILSNVMGSATTGDGFTIQGIFSVYQNGIMIADNDVQNISGTSTSSMLGINFVECMNSTVSANKVHFMRYTGTSTTKVYGVHQANTAYTTVSKPSANTFVNNAVYDLASTAISTYWNVSGINNNGGYGDKYYYNSVYLTGSLSGSAGTGGSGAFSNGNGNTTTNADAIDVRNNVFAVNATSSAAAKLYAHYTARTSYAGSTVDYNVLFATATGTATSAIGRIGTTDCSTLLAWQTATSQEANSRASDPRFVSSTDLHIQTTVPTPVEGAGTPIAGVTVDFDGDLRNVSTPDIGADEGTFIPGGTMVYVSGAATQNSDPLGQGVPGAQIIGVEVVTTGFLYPIAVTQFDLSTNGTTSASNISNARVYYTGTSPVFTTTNQYGSTVLSPNGAFVVTASQVLAEGTNYFWLTYDISSTAVPGNVVDGECTSITVGGNPQTPSPTAPTGNRQILAGLSGDITVGLAMFNQVTGRNLTHEIRTRRVLREVPMESGLPSMGKAASTPADVAVSSLAPVQTQMKEVEEQYGVLMENGKPYDGPLFAITAVPARTENSSFDDIEGVYATITAALTQLGIRGVSGHTRLLLTDGSYPSETFPLVFKMVGSNAPTASATVTLKPAGGVSPTVSGASPSSAIFRIDGMSYVTIDGSNSTGGTTRDMTISNTSTTTPNVVRFGSVAPTPLRSTALKNCVVVNGVNTSSAVIATGVNSTSDSCYFNGLTIQNNSIQKAYMGVYIRGSSVIRSGANLNLIGNTLTTSGSNAIRYIALYVQGTDTGLVNGNDIGNLETATAENDRGIWVAAGSRNITVSKNRVHDLIYPGTVGQGPNGICVSTTTTDCNVKIINNFVYNLRGDGWDYTSSTYPFDNPMGIAAWGTQSGIGIYFNSIYLYGNTLNQTNAMSSGIRLYDGTSADMRNNNVVNNLGLLGSTGYGAVGAYAQSSNSQFTSINNNNYYVNPTGSGVKALGQIASTASTTLSAWRTATLQDGNSISGEPFYVSTSDLHIRTSEYSPVNNAGTSIAGITVDIDGDLRNVTTPDIGADEFSPNVVTLGVGYLSGWSLQCSPVSRLAGTDSVRHLYPTSANPYAFAYAAGAGYVQRYTMANRTGFWVKFGTAGTQDITGCYRDRDSIPVVTGWNLVGGISCTVDTGAITPVGLRASNWWGYGASGYFAATQLVPGKAYWVKANAVSAFVMSCPPMLAAKAEHEVTPVEDSFNSITITDAQGTSQTLRFGPDGKIKVPVAMYEMPPAPPEGCLDARFETEQGGFMLQTHAAAVGEPVEFPIAVRASAYPLTITWKLAGAQANQPTQRSYAYELSDGLGGQAFDKQTMSGEGTMTIRNQAATRFVLTVKNGEQLPTEYALYQNYPNPFNPTTNIKFALPVPSKVTVEIYNILGQLLRTLVDEQRPAGYHVAEWTGTNDAGQFVGSGVYFVRLHADGGEGRAYSEVKKLMMLK